jgi:hypothetical protein
LDFGLSSDEFLVMTPAMFDKLAERKLLAHRREDILFGILNTTVANYSFCSPDPLKKPTDFMLHPPASHTPQPVTPQQQAEHVRRKLVRMFGTPNLLVIGNN